MGNSNDRKNKKQQKGNVGIVDVTKRAEEAKQKIEDEKAKEQVDQTNIGEDSVDQSPETAADGASTANTEGEDKKDETPKVEEVDTDNSKDDGAEEDKDSDDGVKEEEGDEDKETAEPSAGLMGALEGRLKNFKDSLHGMDATVSGRAAASGDLLSTVIGAIESEDYDTFKEGFDLVMGEFKDGKDNDFHPLSINQGDYLWTGTASRVKTYPLISFLLTSLCDPETREENLKSINVSAIKGINAKGLENLIKYFDV